MEPLSAAEIGAPAYAVPERSGGMSRTRRRSADSAFFVKRSGAKAALCIRLLKIQERCIMVLWKKNDLMVSFFILRRGRRGAPGFLKITGRKKMSGLCSP